MPTFMTFLLRLFLLAAGLVFAASLAVGLVLMLALWSVRAAWARLTGKPVRPFIMRMGPLGGFQRMYRQAQPQPQESRTPRADAVVSAREAGDVTDVEPRTPGR